MNRRKALIKITLAGAGIAAAVGGYTWYEISKTPDLAYLDQHKDLIASLAETIIPATDTPGAKEARVHDFIIMMIKECTERKTQNKFLNGLKDLQNYSRTRYQKLYQQCSADEQQDVLAYFEKHDKPFGGKIGKAQVRYLGQPFFITLKRYTVEGYCTSQAGATKHLAYAYIPGNFQGCIDLQPGQKAWATN